ncbi:unnamed protein product [Caenorhabditis auriculariae]|uniref:Glutamyl-tRNA(Gln) amidotransferase subunit B, mitochondrial n=1 Tax=Caenorhabditis auriculariae TaxID=2777116 RepID=A0A8S1GR63_9PELO|nr:unnamed protein product [Caenorhabditis auriculariae]
MLQTRILRRISAMTASTSSATPSTSEGHKDRSRYRPVIGLEVHVQLNTRTKLFSRTPAGLEAGPNRLVSPFDMALPGTMPALNKQAVMHALKMAKLLKCTVPEKSRFDRKHYFYADMPAGYQITQTDMPIARDGSFAFHVFDEHVEPYWKEVPIIQLQLEQDSGKTIHHGKKCCALVEIVTTPCLRTALEATCFVQHLRLILMHYQICLGELHRGHLRVDANVSLSYDGKPGTRIEVKNINSVRCLHTAINYEIERQFSLLSRGEKIVKETRAADPEGRTVSMREKEDDTDYRFIPEPNLPLLKIQPEWREMNDRWVETQPPPRFQKFRDEFGFNPRSALHLAEDETLSSFIERCAEHFVPLENLTANDILVWMKELKTTMQRSKDVYPPASNRFAEQFVRAIDLYKKNRITRLRMLDLLRNLSADQESRTVDQILDAEDLWKIENADEIVSDLLKSQEKISEKARQGHAKSFGRLRNLAVEGSRKRIDVDQIEASLKRLLGLKT